MEPTIVDIERLIKRLGVKVGIDKNAVDRWYKSCGIVAAAKHIVISLWQKDIPEDEDTSMLRHQLNHLDSQGMWDYRKED